MMGVIFNRELLFGRNQVFCSEGEILGAPTQAVFITFQ